MLTDTFHCCLLQSFLLFGTYFDFVEMVYVLLVMRDPYSYSGGLCYYVQMKDLFARYNARALHSQFKFHFSGLYSATKRYLTVHLT